MTSCEDLLKPDLLSYVEQKSLKIAWFKAFDDQRNSREFSAFVAGELGDISDDEKFSHIQEQENYTFDKEESKWLLIAKVPPDRGVKFLQCVNGQEGVIVENYNIGDDFVHLDILWRPPPDSVHATKVSWTNGHGSVFPIGQRDRAVLSPNSTTPFEFRREKTKPFDIFAKTNSGHVAEFHVPSERIADEPTKAAAIALALKAGKVCQVQLHGTGNLDALYPNVYNIHVLHNAQQPDQSRWITTGPVKNSSHPFWTEELSLAFDRGIGDPAQGTIWVVSATFALKPDGSIISNRPASDGSIWTGLVSDG